MRVRARVRVRVRVRVRDGVRVGARVRARVRAKVRAGLLQPLSCRVQLPTRPRDLPDAYWVAELQARY